MEILIKNDRAAEIMKYAALTFEDRDDQKEIDWMKGLSLTDEKVCETVIGAYAYDVMGRALSHDKVMDMSYATISALPIGLQEVLQG